jgi:hypothetical protein
MDSNLAALKPQATPREQCSIEHEHPEQSRLKTGTKDQMGHLLTVPG